MVLGLTPDEGNFIARAKTRNREDLHACLFFSVRYSTRWLIAHTNSMISPTSSLDSELRLDQDDDPHMAHDWIFNPEAIQCCPNNNPLIDFAGYQWWTNFHWSQASGPYVWGVDDPTEPLFGTVFDPSLITH